MRQLKLGKAVTLIESGPVVLVTTHDGTRNNIMTISWTMVLDFTPAFAIATGAWNYSFAALRKTRECVIAIPTVDLLDRVVGIGRSEEHTSELQSLMRISYAVFCLKKNKITKNSQH